MTISVKVVADSSHKGSRITTIQCSYPLFIHAEVMTHRKFSRNAASNRAIPFTKLRKLVLNDIAIPMYWGANKPGMQADSELSRTKQKLLKGLWIGSAYAAAGIATLANKLGLHKQHVNRLLMPYQHIDVIITATDWDNFFELRDHEDAQPEIRDLAQKIKKAMAESKPTELKVGMWHLPYVSEREKAYLPLGVLENISAARCARVSYLTHDKEDPVIRKDTILATKLKDSKHMSPFEHQASPCASEETQNEMTRNFTGWIQHRSLIETA